MSVEMKKEALDMEQLEIVSGGARTKHNKPCTHSFIFLGESKEENGVKYVYVQCENCGYTDWVEQASLFAPAIKAR